MASRPRVIDPHEPSASEPFVCPSCGAPLSWVKTGHLRAVPIPCRCGNANHTHVVYELRCRDCSEILQLRDRRDGLSGYVVVGRGSISNARDRIDTIATIERRFERDDDR